MPDRRALIGGSLLGAVAATAPAAGRASQPDYPRLHPRAAARVIVDNDFDGDPDGLVALAHQLLSPTTEVRAVTSNDMVTGFARSLGITAMHGAARARELIGLITAAAAPAPAVFAGATTSFDPASSQSTPAAEAIVAEARREDSRPLFLTCGGPLTNVAAALRLDLSIARRMTLVWIGGGAYPDGSTEEYNLGSDIRAAQTVFAAAELEIWQVPMTTYRTCLCSVAELEAEVRPLGRVGDWLWRRFASVPPQVPVGGVWPLGDSPLVLATALDSQSSVTVDHPRPTIRDDGRYGPGAGGRPVRVYQQIDFRLILGDFLARLKLLANAQQG